MTAEERAAVLVNRDGGRDYYYEGWAREESIASAIRAAEDEALERAAGIADNEPDWIIGKRIASCIRSLKSTGGAR